MPGNTGSLILPTHRDGQRVELTLLNAPVNVSYAERDCIPGSVILPVILYIQQPWFLMHSGQPV